MYNKKINYKLSKFTLIHSIKESYLVFNSLLKKGMILELESYQRLLKLSLSDAELKKYSKLGFVVNKELDETKCYETLFRRRKSKHFNLMVRLTDDCNCDCAYCIENNSIYKRKNNISVNEENLIKFIENNIKYFENIELTIQWTGGEPLILYQKLLSILKKVNEVAKKYNLRINHHLLTNGILLNYTRCLELKNNGMKVINISTYGVGRKTTKKNGFDSCEKLEDFIQFLIPLTKVIDIKLTMLATKGMSLDFKKFFKSNVVQLIKSISINRVLNTMECTTNVVQPKLLTREEFDEMLERITTDSDLKNINLSSNQLLANCSASLQDGLVVTPSGHLYDCDLLVGDNQSIIGLLKNFNLDELFKKKYKFSNNCKECKVLPICNGGCIYHQKIRTDQCLGQWNDFKITEKSQKEYMNQIYRKMIKGSSYENKQSY